MRRPTAQQTAALEARVRRLEPQPRRAGLPLPGLLVTPPAGTPWPPKAAERLVRLPDGRVAAQTGSTYIRQHKEVSNGQSA